MKPTFFFFATIIALAIAQDPELSLFDEEDDGGVVPSQGQMNFDPSFKPGEMMGDMILTKQQHADLITPERNAITNPLDRWPNKTIPYTFDEKIPYTEARKKMIAKALKSFEVQTGGCIKMVPRTDESEYINIINDKGCYSWVGHGRGTGMQELWLSGGCGRNAVVHEFLHALGFWHEHNRPDRDDYINLHWENMPKKFQYAFYKKSGSRKIGSYDYISVMHYWGTAFSTNGKPTITRKDGKTGKWTLGNWRGMTYEDVQKLMTLYECPNEQPCEDHDFLYDYQSGDCADWAAKGLCQGSAPEFMKFVCRRSCGYCDP